jgi:hypothetical protein
MTPSAVNLLQQQRAGDAEAYTTILRIEHLDQCLATPALAPSNAAPL